MATENQYLSPEEIHMWRAGWQCMICGARFMWTGIMLCAQDVCDGCYPAVADDADKDTTRTWDRAFIAAKYRAKHAREG